MSNSFNLSAIVLLALIVTGCSQPSSSSTVLPADIVQDSDPEIARFRRALVRYCIQEPSLTEAIQPTATKPAHVYPDRDQIQIDLWLIDTNAKTFQLMTSTPEPIWIVSGSFVEVDGEYVADGQIAELHYQ